MREGKPLTMVILAAGMGRRYGGLKQIEPVGPCGELLLDYSVYDAWRAGFRRVVFVVRPEMQAAFDTKVGKEYRSRVEVIYAHQRVDDLPSPWVAPPGRIKPWGTAHAVLVAAPALDDSFAVANADDFYGAGSFERVAEFLREPQMGDVPTHAMVCFALRDTLSETGEVSRGLCRCTGDGWLIEITETTGLQRHGTGARQVRPDGTERLFPGDTSVSMNLWAFQHCFLEQVRAGFTLFLREHGPSADREFYLPGAVNELVQAQRARVRVLSTRDRWCGITHQQDLARAADHIRELVARGDYPARLWT